MRGSDQTPRKDSGVHRVQGPESDLPHSPFLRNGLPLTNRPITDRPRPRYSPPPRITGYGRDIRRSTDWPSQDRPSPTAEPLQLLPSWQPRRRTSRPLSGRPPLPRAIRATMSPIQASNTPVGPTHRLTSHSFDSTRTRAASPLVARHCHPSPDERQPLDTPTIRYATPAPSHTGPPTPSPVADGRLPMPPSARHYRSLQRPAAAGPSCIRFVFRSEVSSRFASCASQALPVIPTHRQKSSQGLPGSAEAKSHARPRRPARPLRHSSQPSGPESPPKPRPTDYRTSSPPADMI